MHTVYIADMPAGSAQEIADAVHFAPESVRIESGPEIDSDACEGPLLDLTPHSHVLFMAGDGGIGELHIGSEGKRLVEAMTGKMTNNAPDGGT